MEVKNKMTDTWVTSCDNCWLFIDTNATDIPKEDFCNCGNRK